MNSFIIHSVKLTGETDTALAVSSLTACQLPNLEFFPFTSPYCVDPLLLQAFILREMVKWQLFARLLVIFFLISRVVCALRHRTMSHDALFPRTAEACRSFTVSASVWVCALWIANKAYYIELFVLYPFRYTFCHSICSHRRTQFPYSSLFI